MVLNKRLIKKTRKKIKRKKTVVKSKTQKDVTSSFFSKEFTNRDIGWLYFNFRVLHESRDVRNPLLERVKFLSVSSSNLDEFIMKRVGRLKKQLAYGISTKTSDGQMPIHRNVNNNTLIIYRDGLPAGIYTAKIGFDKGVIAKQIIFE